MAIYSRLFTGFVELGILTDCSFSDRIEHALGNGWTLHESPTIGFNEHERKLWAAQTVQVQTDDVYDFDKFIPFKDLPDFSTPGVETPHYRLVVGKDDSAFCHNVEAMLNQGWQLHGNPALTFYPIRQHMVAAHALIRHEP